MRSGGVLEEEGEATAEVEEEKSSQRRLNTRRVSAPLPHIGSNMEKEEEDNRVSLRRSETAANLGPAEAGDRECYAEPFVESPPD